MTISWAWETPFDKNHVPSIHHWAELHCSNAQTQDEGQQGENISWQRRDLMPGLGSNAPKTAKQDHSNHAET